MTGSSLPPWSFDLDGFFYFLPLRFLFGWIFLEVPGAAFIRKVLHIQPLWFLGYDSTISYPRGYYSGCGFLKVPGDAFIWRRFFIYYPCGYYLGYGFTKIPGDVFIPPMCTIQQHRVHQVSAFTRAVLKPDRLI